MKEETKCDTCESLCGFCIIVVLIAFACGFGLGRYLFPAIPETYEPSLHFAIGTSTVVCMNQPKEISLLSEREDCKKKGGNFGIKAKYNSIISDDYIVTSLTCISPAKVLSEVEISN